jgi:hypothetical protein
MSERASAREGGQEQMSDRASAREGGQEGGRDGGESTHEREHLLISVVTHMEPGE